MSVHIPLKPYTAPEKTYTHYVVTMMRYQENQNTPGIWALNVNLEPATDDGELDSSRRINLNIWDMAKAIEQVPSCKELAEIATRVAFEMLEALPEHNPTGA